MSLDNRIRSTLTDVTSDASFDPDSDIQSVRNSGKRRLLLRRVGATVGAMTLVLVVFLAGPEVLRRLGAEQIDSIDRPTDGQVETDGEERGERAGGGDSRSSDRGSSSEESSSAGGRGSPKQGIRRDGGTTSKISATIAFERTGVIYLIEADGSGLRRLVEGSAPSWSPDGTRIALGTHTDGGELQIASADGSHHRSLGISGAQPSWSPDGRMLAFNWPYDASKVGCRPYDDAPGAAGPECGIGVVNADGSGLRWLGTGRWPEWGPDGRVVFGDGNPTGCHYDAPSASDALTEWASGRSLPKCALPVWVMNGDGSGRHRLAAERAIRPTWSPDGRRIAYHNDESGVLVENLDGSARVWVAPAGYLDASWSPSGSWLAMGRLPSSRDTALLGIYIWEVDGLSERRLTSNHEVDWFTHTSPRG